MTLLRTFRAALVALAVALISAPAATASTTYGPHPATYGPAMSVTEIRTMQAQGVREIIVKRAEGLSAAQQAAVRSQAGISYVGPGPLPNTELDRAPAGRLAAAVTALRQDAEVQYAEPNGEMHATSEPNDTYFGQQWALENTGQYVYNARGTAGDDIGAVYAWPQSTGTGVTVAVVDTGADYSVGDLSGRLVDPGVDYVDSGNGAQDQNGHGTHVAGIIAAKQDNFGVSGVAPGATVLPLRVLDAYGSGTIANVASAFNYAGLHNIAIVNASLGGAVTSQALTDAVTNHPNTLYVVAAGNGDPTNHVGYDVDSTPFYPCDIPASNLICVGASDQNDQPAEFSNYGTANVDLFAPGVNILSTWLASQGGYAYADGTSMATPMVSGTLALMLAHNSLLTAAQLKSDLLASVDPAPQLAGLSASGGELDAAAAVATAGPDAPYAAPGNRERPQVSGAALVGATLSATPGSWSRLPDTYAYQWNRCVMGACLPVDGATTATYDVGADDYGASLYVAVTATNGFGSTDAISPATSTVDVDGPDPVPAPPSPSSSPATTSPAAGSAPAPAPAVSPKTPAPPVRLTNVGLVHPRGAGGGPALMFTLSARGRVQVTLARSGGPGRTGGTAGGVMRVALSARQGPNRYALATLLHGRRLARGRYTLTVRAGNRAVVLHLTV